VTQVQSALPYLWISPRSPFARRVRVALKRLGIRYEERPINVLDPPAEFRADAPLGLVPVWVAGPIKIADSNMILEHLEDHTWNIWPEDPPFRARVREASVLATGVMTAAVAHFLEREHANPDPSFLAEHESAIVAALFRLNSFQESVFVGNEGGPTQAGIDFVIATEYLALRVPHLLTRIVLPSWAEKISMLPELAETRPPT
jgi:glutathione S-transferase